MSQNLIPRAVSQSNFPGQLTSLEFIARNGVRFSLRWRHARRLKDKSDERRVR